MGAWRDNRATIVAGALVAALVVGSVGAVGAQAHPAANGNSGSVAIVHASDGSTRRLPLDEDATVTVTTDLGTNVIAVEGGTVRMVEADCPQGSCTRQHAISASGEQIVCLPHRLWVEVASNGDDMGAAMDVNAVTWDDDSNETAIDLVAR